MNGAMYRAFLELPQRVELVSLAGSGQFFNNSVGFRFPKDLPVATLIDFDGCAALDCVHSEAFGERLSTIHKYHNLSVRPWLLHVEADLENLSTAAADDIVSFGACYAL